MQDVTMNETHQPSVPDKPRQFASKAAITPWSIAWLLGLLVATVVALRWEGRRWWCACGNPTPLSSDAWGSHNSQHFLDPYSLTHVEHGVIFFAAVLYCFPAWSAPKRLVWATVIECGWEIWENSAFVIDRYRTATAALGYQGDSVANAVGDILACIAGYLMARWLGLWRSVAFLVMTEVLLLFWIRDNLTLNILMLAWPIDAISKWQAG
jgi:hypothetical protein